MQKKMNGFRNKAKELLRGHTCVIFDGERIYTSDESGINSLVKFVDGGFDFKSFSAADKIVGRAAAFFYIFMGIKEVYAEVMSEGAKKLFSEHNIRAEYETLTENIINRAGTDICPMEKAVKGADSPESALEAIRKTMLKGRV